MSGIQWLAVWRSMTVSPVSLATSQEEAVWNVCAPQRPQVDVDGEKAGADGADADAGDVGAP